MTPTFTGATCSCRSHPSSLSLTFRQQPFCQYGGSNKSLEEVHAALKCTSVEQLDESDPTQRSADANGQHRQTLVHGTAEHTHPHTHTFTLRHRVNSFIYPLTKVTLIWS